MRGNRSDPSYAVEAQFQLPGISGNAGKILEVEVPFLPAHTLASTPASRRSPVHVGTLAPGLPRASNFRFPQCKQQAALRDGGASHICLRPSKGGALQVEDPPGATATPWDPGTWHSFDTRLTCISPSSKPRELTPPPPPFAISYGQLTLALQQAEASAWPRGKNTPPPPWADGQKCNKAKSTKPIPCGVGAQSATQTEYVSILRQL